MYHIGSGGWIVNWRGGHLCIIVVHRARNIHRKPFSHVLQVIMCIYKVCNRRSFSSRSIPHLVLAKPCLVTLFLCISTFLVGLKLSQVRSSEMRTEEQEQGAYQHESAHHVHRSSKSPPKSDVVRVEHVFASRSLTAMKSQQSFRGPGRILSWAFSASFLLRV